MTKGTLALLRGGDLLQLGLRAWRGTGSPTQRMRGCGCARRLLLLGKSQLLVLVGAEFLWEWFCCIPLGMVLSTLGECHKHCHVTAPEPPKNTILKLHGCQTIPAAPSPRVGILPPAQEAWSAVRRGLRGKMTKMGNRSSRESALR